jgi:hypothetical protein
MPDATGFVEYLLEVDGNSVGWQMCPTFAVSGLSPNTQYALRIKAKDASPDANETAWSDSNSVYTLAEIPPTPTLISADMNSIDIRLDMGGNPATTELALYNASTDEWLDQLGEVSADAVWADANAYGTVHIDGLDFDTTYHFQCKARNEAGIETDLSPVFAAKTKAPDSFAALTADREWLYETGPNTPSQQIMLSAEFANDPYANSGYTYTWQAPVDPVTGKALVLVSGGEPNDSNGVYIAPEGWNDYPGTYSVVCTVTGKDHGNSVSRTFYIPVYARSDLNRDGEIGYGDIATLCNYWLGNDPETDIAPRPSGDGMIDFLDFALLTGTWRASLVRRADFDGSQFVNYLDFSKLAAFWMVKDCNTQANCDGCDFEPDGDVDFDDLRQFTDLWLEGTTP